MATRRLTLFAATLIPAIALAQTTPPAPPDYPGVRTHVPGIWVTPVPNAPFIATVDIVSHQKLPDGTEHIVTTKNHIARSSSGRIYNERRRLVSTAFQGEPILLSAHVFDPSSRLNVFWDPFTHLARQTVLPTPPRPPAGQTPDPKRPDVLEESLGTQIFQGLTLTGLRKSRKLPADRSGTGQPITITDEYWYSPDLSLYVIVKHNDPRTGEQLVAANHIQRTEPDAQWFTIPADYKIVDETPPAPTYP